MMQPESKIPRVIVLEQNGQHVSIDDDLLELLGDLMVRHLVGVDDAQHGYEVRKQRQSLLRSPEGYRLPNAGCISLLQELAAQRGVTLLVQPSPPIVELPEPAHLDQLAYPCLPSSSACRTAD